MRHVLSRVLTAGLALCLVAGPVRAADAPPDSVAPRTLADYLRLARAANAELNAATYRASAAHERVGSAGAFMDPRLDYGYYVSPDQMEGRQEFLLRQEFPFFGKRGLEREAAARDAQAQTHQAAAVALDVDYAVKAAFYRYVGLSETASVLESEAGLLRRMREVAQIRYSAGTSEQQEVLKIELSLSRLADDNTMNDSELTAVRARLNELIGRNAAADLPAPDWSLPDSSVVNALAIPDSAIARRPEIAAAREQIASADASRRRAKKEYIPDFMLGVKYEFGAAGPDWWEVMAGVNLPIWLGKRRAMVREAEAMQQSAQYSLEAATLRTGQEVEAASARARAARERFDRFRTAILPQAQAAFESSEAGYRTGRVGFLDYLDSERTLLEIRREFAMVIADLGIQLAALERAVALPSAGEVLR